MTRPLPILLTLLSPVLLANCFTPGKTCPVHCWQHDTTWSSAPLDSDLTPSSQDFECSDASTNDVLVLSSISELASASFNGVACPQTQADHEAVSHMIATIEAGTGSAQSGSDIQTYQDFVVALTLALRNDCLAELTAPDIDPGTPGLQSCSHASAVDVCNAYILHPTQALLGDLNAGASFDPPIDAPPQYKSIAAEDVCDYLPDLGEQATGGGNDDGDGGGTTGGGDDGLDGTGSSTGAPVVDPFGDISTLVWCDQTGISCVYQDELLTNISANFTVFYQEEVTLTLLRSTDAGYPGAVLGGLDAGEASYDLASAFGLKNDDIIKNVNGFDIIDEADALAAIDALINSEALALSLERAGKPILYRIVLRQ